MASKIQIISRAASLTGNGPLVSLDDNAQVAQIVEEAYDGLVEALLTQHAWKFARRSASLSRLSATPEKPWSSLWQAPTGMLALHYVLDTTSGLRVDHEERDVSSGRAIAVLGDWTALSAVYTYRVDEGRWPGDFALAVQKHMEAAFLRGINEQRDQADRVERRADAVEQKARVRDQRSSSAVDASEWDLSAARNRLGRWRTGRA